MIISAKTDIGKSRSENQDRFRICELDDNTGIAIVCDGMGGTNGGGIASEIASNAVYERLCLSYRDGMEPRAIKSMLVSAITAANTIVFDKSSEEDENRGMGTTCVAALVHRELCCVASVGDSRAYLLSEDGIRQITSDHTVVEFLKARGMIDEKEAKQHAMRNVITRAVGVEPTVEVDYFEFEAAHGSVLLICTDGLSNYCPNEIIYSTAYKSPPEEAAAELIDYANSHGGKDNITVAMIVI